MPTSRKTYSELTEGIEKFFVADVTKLVSNKVPGFRESELRYLTFLYTCPLTTLFGMQSAMMPDRSHIKVGTNFFKQKNNSQKWYQSSENRRRKLCFLQFLQKIYDFSPNFCRKGLNWVKSKITKAVDYVNSP